MTPMPASNDRAASAARPAAEVFDRALLNEYSMQDQGLAAEILELFLVQLPAMVTALETADCQTAWSFATHTLKGSSATIGARRLQVMAAELDAMPFRPFDNVRLLRIQAVKAAASDFQQAARQAYPARS
jgi:HPt (histidine-containing phosphotransfer) domain-containing protein